MSVSIRGKRLLEERRTDVRKRYNEIMKSNEQLNFATIGAMLSLEFGISMTTIIKDLRATKKETEGGDDDDN